MTTTPPLPATLFGTLSGCLLFFEFIFFLFVCILTFYQCKASFEKLLTYRLYFRAHLLLSGDFHRPYFFLLLLLGTSARSLFLGLEILSFQQQLSLLHTETVSHSYRSPCCSISHTGREYSITDCNGLKDGQHLRELSSSQGGREHTESSFHNNNIRHNIIGHSSDSAAVNINYIADNSVKNDNYVGAASVRGEGEEILLSKEVSIGGETLPPPEGSIEYSINNRSANRHRQTSLREEGSGGDNGLLDEKERSERLTENVDINERRYCMKNKLNEEEVTDIIYSGRSDTKLADEEESIGGGDVSLYNEKNRGNNKLINTSDTTDVVRVDEEPHNALNSSTTVSPSTHPPPPVVPCRPTHLSTCPHPISVDSTVWYHILFRCLPSLFFLASYTLVVLFWLQIDYACRRAVPPFLIRPVVCTLFASVCLIFVGLSWLTFIHHKYKQFRQYAMLIVGFLYIVVGTAWLIYGLIVYTHLRRRRARLPSSSSPYSSSFMSVRNGMLYSVGDEGVEHASETREDRRFPFDGSRVGGDGDAIVKIDCCDTALDREIIQPTGVWNFMPGGDIQDERRRRSSAVVSASSWSCCGMYELDSRVLLLTLLCGFLFIFRGIYNLLVIIHEIRKYYYFSHSMDRVEWDAAMYLATEGIPSLLMLVVFWHSRRPRLIPSTEPPLELWDSREEDRGGPVDLWNGCGHRPTNQLCGNLGSDNTCAVLREPLCYLPRQHKDEGL
eukprot:GHVQ01004254.1.p1 GENE.GHVQ01004254.1~~GHVQ01004254.1.p1  ORF type:complete len:727 (+),score=141.95 GHVQ01004254.1:105-2285(+)